MDKNEYYGEKLSHLANSQDRIFDRPKVEGEVKDIHIIGICGTAMGSLAGLLKENGYNVRGSDSACHPPIRDMHDILQIPYKEGFDENNIGKADAVVIGNVSGPQNPEAVFARENNLPQLSLPEAIDQFVARDKKKLLISGTHGKTTTTGLVASIFEQAEKDPSYFIGGIMQGKEKSYRKGDGEYFIMEGDEYDTAYFDKRPKFLVYGATSAIVTSIELDHLDIYDDFTDYMMAFRFFAKEIPGDGFLVLNFDDKNVRSLANYTKAKVISYGESSDANVTYKNLKSGTRVQAFDLIVDGENLGRLETPLSGEYNVLNICAASALAIQYGIKIEDIFLAVKNFKGMKRRQEIVFENEKVIFIDDFAHHPTSVRETLAGIKKKFKGHRIVTLFEPRSNSSRKKIFEKDYMESFNDTDVLYMKIPPFRHNDKKEDFMDADTVVNHIKDKGKEAKVFETADEIVNEVTGNLKDGDLIIMMSNGGFDGLREKLVDELK